MASEKSLELQVQTLEKGMGTLVRAFKELKASVRALEDKMENKYNEEIKEIKENQEMLGNLLEANSKAIKKVDNIILTMNNENPNADQKKPEEKNKPKKELKRCKFFNSGYCKYKLECKFSHPKEVCKVYLEEGKCNQKQCKNRHPKVCKWLKRESGCKRADCDYLHVTLARDDEHRNKTHKSFPCAGCKNCYDDISCVVQYRMNNIALICV